MRSQLFKLILGAAAAVAVNLSGGRAAADGDRVYVVHFAAAGQPHPLNLSGFLRRPGGDGPFPAVVLLHGCGGDAEGLDRNWGARLQSWGYVSLTVDSFGPRGITNSCHGGEPTGRDLDPYGALQFLARQTFVASSRVALMGFSEGGIVTLNHVELTGQGEPGTPAFHAAIAFYPLCAGSGIVTVPILILNGELDDWSSARACQKMVAQESDIGISRHKAASAPISLVILPGAYHKFDDPAFQLGRRYMGHLLEYDPAALNHAAADVHHFLRAQLAAQ